MEIEVELVMEKRQGAGSSQLLVYGYVRSVNVGVIHHARPGGRGREGEERAVWGNLWTKETTRTKRKKTR